MRVSDGSALQNVSLTAALPHTSPGSDVDVALRMDLLVQFVQCLIDCRPAYTEKQ